MPNILYGNKSARTDVRKMHKTGFNYNYPNGLNLKPGSDMHDKLLTLVMEKASTAASAICTRFPDWQRMDESLIAYKRADDDEAKVLQDDDRKPVSIVFPYSYAILETLLSYMMAAFFRDPMFRYEGTGPNDVVGAILLSKIVNLHVNKFKVMLNFHTMFRDSFAYGAGIVAPYWKYKNNGFAGNALLNIDPYRYLPDPNAPADNPQAGEYNGWTSDTNYVSLLSDEFDNEDMFNVKYLAELDSRGTSIYDRDQSGRYAKGGGVKNLSDSNKPVTEINMYIKLIPKEYKLSTSERPELWHFRVAADSVIILARNAGFDHEQYPLAAAVPDTDGYSSSPIGKLEILSGMQGVLDFLFNSHITNVRKAINDTLIYDPSLINTNDLKDGKPGGLIRMKRQAWGQGRISDAVHQLQINDVTRQNVGDAGWMINNMQTLMGTDAATMGSLRQGGPDRLTKAEFQGTASGGITRLERTARLVGLQAFQDVGEKFAEHTQQMMTDDQYIKITGDWQEVLLQEYGPQGNTEANRINRGRLSIDPRELDVNYDVIIRDGSVPGGNYSEVWLRMFDQLSQNPALANQFDMVRIFKHIARNAGAKNVNDFVRRGGNISASTQPDQNIQQEVQRGNLVPISGGR